MDISVAGLFGVSPSSDAGYVKAFAQATEALGFRGLYLPEHVVFFPTYESSYPYTDDGKIPEYDPWAERVKGGTASWDGLLSEAALASFATDQAKLDDRIRQHL